MLPAVAGCVRSRAGHHLRHGRERHLDISLRALPSVRHQDKRRRLTSADICAIREAELILRQDICQRFNTPAAGRGSCSCRHLRPLDIMQHPTSGKVYACHGECAHPHAAAPWRQGHGREGAGSGRGACRTWKTFCRHGREGAIRSRSPAGSCSTPIRHGRAPDIRQDIRLRHLDKVTPAPAARPHASAPLREKDIRQCAGHGAAGSGALKHLILITLRPWLTLSSGHVLPVLPSFLMEFLPHGARRQGQGTSPCAFGLQLPHADKVELPTWNSPRHRQT